MAEIVTDPAKIVTDEQVLARLAEQGIDKDYVEFWHDYAPRGRGEEYSPYAKFYRDLKSGQHIGVFSGLPGVKPDGQKIEVGWLYSEGKYHSKANLFSAVVEGKQVKLTCLSDQPNGTKEDEQVTYKPQLFIDGVEIVNGSEPTLLPVDPINENYQENTLEWTYDNVAQRRIRIIEGRYRDKFFILSHPYGRVSIKNNCVGSLRLRLGRAVDAEGNPVKVTVIGDEEIIEASEFDKAVFPVEIGAIATYYPDAHPETTSVDGDVAHIEVVLTWADLVGEAGNWPNDSANTLRPPMQIWASTTANRWSHIYRGIFLFDTSGLPNSAIISGAVFSFYGGAKADELSITPDINIYESDPASNDELVDGDYATLGSIAYCDTPIIYANIDDNGYNDFALNATGIAAISLIGVTKLGARNANYDAAVNTPSNWVSGKRSHMHGWMTDKGTGFKPKLVVTYYVIPRHGFVNFQDPGIV